MITTNDNRPYSLPSWLNRPVPYLVFYNMACTYDNYNIRTFSARVSFSLILGPIFSWLHCAKIANC